MLSTWTRAGDGENRGEMEWDWTNVDLVDSTELGEGTDMGGEGEEKLRRTPRSGFWMDGTGRVWKGKVTNLLLEY